MNEPETDSADSSDHDPAPKPEAPSGRSTALVLAISLAVVFAVAASVLAVLLASRGDGDGEIDDVRAAAGIFGETLVSYSFADPEAHRDAIVSMSTPSFQDEYERAFEQGLADLIKEMEAESRGFVKDVYVSTVDSNQVQAIVVVDVEHDGKAGPNRLYDVYFRLTMIEADGRWLVDDVTDLNFATGGAAPTAPNTSTTEPGEDPSGTSSTSVP